MLRLILHAPKFRTFCIPTINYDIIPVARREEKRDDQGRIKKEERRKEKGEKVKVLDLGTCPKEEGEKKGQSEGLRDGGKFCFGT